MKKIYFIVAVLLVLTSAYAFLRTDGGSVVDTTTTYSNPELGFEFSYKTGPQGYVVEERISDENAQAYMRSVILMQEKDIRQDGSESVSGGEEPAAIHIDVFKNTQNKQPSVWAMEYPTYSNFALKQGDVEETVVGGARAVRYVSDGLYTTDTIVVAHGGYIYVLKGMYIDKDSSLRKDFQPIVDSFTFIPVGDQLNAKIDIDAVCKGALSYMTFANGQESDAFVQDCKDGKHPEVIEKYKKDMNVGDGALI